MTFTLEDLPLNQEAHILDFHAELSEEFRLRLRELGFREGATVRYIRRSPLGGPRVFVVSGSVFSIERDLAGKIGVQLG